MDSPFMYWDWDKKDQDKFNKMLDEWKLENYPLLTTNLNPDGKKQLQELMEKTDHLIKEGHKPWDLIKTIFDHLEGGLYCNKEGDLMPWTFCGCSIYDFYEGGQWMKHRIERDKNSFPYYYLDNFLFTIYEKITKDEGNVFLNPYLNSNQNLGNQNLLDIALRIFANPIALSFSPLYDEVYNSDYAQPDRSKIRTSYVHQQLHDFVYLNQDLNFSRYPRYYIKLWDFYDKVKQELPNCYFDNLAEINLYENCALMMETFAEANLDEDVETRLIKKMFEYIDKPDEVYLESLDLLVNFLSQKDRDQKYPAFNEQIADYIFEKQFKNGNFEKIPFVLCLNMENKNEYVSKCIDEIKLQAIKGNYQPLQILTRYDIIDDNTKKSVVDWTLKNCPKATILINGYNKYYSTNEVFQAIKEKHGYDDLITAAETYGNTKNAEIVCKLVAKADSKTILKLIERISDEKSIYNNLDIQHQGLLIYEIMKRCGSMTELQKVVKEISPGEAFAKVFDHVFEEFKVKNQSPKNKEEKSAKKFLIKQHNRINKTKEEKA